MKSASRIGVCNYLLRTLLFLSTVQFAVNLPQVEVSGNGLAEIATYTVGSGWYPHASVKGILHIPAPAGMRPRSKS